MFEEQIGRELQPEPILELDDQEHRVGGIEAHAGERRLRVCCLVRQVELTCQVFLTPVSDRGFARIFNPQNKLLITTRYRSRVPKQLPIRRPLGGVGSWRAKMTP